MKTILAAYLATALTFLGCDMIWLGLAADRLYRPQLKGLLLDRFAIGPAAAFYLLYVAGILVFAVFPARAAGHWSAATLRGGLLGLVAYATYDLTNQATLRGWSGIVTIADLCWGVALTATAATIGYLIATRV